MLSGCKTFKNTYRFKPNDIIKTVKNHSVKIRKLTDVYVKWFLTAANGAIKHLPNDHLKFFDGTTEYLVKIIMTLSTETAFHMNVADDDERADILWLQHYAAPLTTLGKAFQTAGYPHQTCQYLRDFHDSDMCPEPALYHRRVFDYGEYIKCFALMYLSSPNVGEYFDDAVSQFIDQWIMISSNPKIAKKLSGVEVPMMMSPQTLESTMIYRPLRARHMRALASYDVNPDGSGCFLKYDDDDTFMDVSDYVDAIDAWMTHEHKIWYHDEYKINKKLTNKDFTNSLMNPQIIRNLPIFIKRYLEAKKLDDELYKSFCYIPHIHDDRMPFIRKDKRRAALVDLDNLTPPETAIDFDIIIDDVKINFVYIDYIDYIARKRFPYLGNVAIHNRPRSWLGRIAAETFISLCMETWSFSPELFDSQYEQYEQEQENWIQGEMDRYEKNFHIDKSRMSPPYYLREFDAKLRGITLDLEKFDTRTTEQWLESRRESAKYGEDIDIDDHEIIPEMTEEDRLNQERHKASIIRDCMIEAKDGNAIDIAEKIYQDELRAAKQKVVKMQRDIGPEIVTGRISQKTVANISHFEDMRRHGPIYDEMFSEMPYKKIPIIYKIERFIDLDTCTYSNVEFQLMGEWFRGLAVKYHSRFCRREGDENEDPEADVKFPQCCETGLYNYCEATLGGLLDHMIDNCKNKHAKIVYRLKHSMGITVTYGKAIRQIVSNLLRKNWTHLPSSVSELIKIFYQINNKKSLYEKLYGKITGPIQVAFDFNEKIIKPDYTLDKKVYRANPVNVYQPDVNGLKKIDMATKKLHDYQRWLSDVATNIVLNRKISGNFYTARPALRSVEALKASDLVQKTLFEAAKIMTPSNDTLLDKVKEIFPYFPSFDVEIYNLTIISIRNLFVTSRWKSMIMDIISYEDTLRTHMKGCGLGDLAKTLRIGYNNHMPKVKQQTVILPENDKQLQDKREKNDIRLYKAREIYEWTPILLPEDGVVDIKDLLGKISTLSPDRKVQACYLVDALAERTESLKAYFENQKRQLYVDIHNNIYIQTGPFRAARKKEKIADIKRDVLLSIVASLKEHYDALVSYGATPLTDEELVNDKFATDALDTYQNFVKNDYRNEFKSAATALGIDSITRYTHFYTNKVAPKAQKVSGFLFAHALMLTQGIERAVLELNPHVKMPVLVTPQKAKKTQHTRSYKKIQNNNDYVKITGKAKKTYESTGIKLGSTREKNSQVTNRACNALYKKSEAEFSLRNSSANNILMTISDELREVKAGKKMTIEELQRIINCIDIARDKIETKRTGSTDRNTNTNTNDILPASRAEILGAKEIILNAPKKAPVETLKTFNKLAKVIENPVVIKIDMTPHVKHEKISRIRSVRIPENDEKHEEIKLRRRAIISKLQRELNGNTGNIKPSAENPKRAAFLSKLHRDLMANTGNMKPSVENSKLQRNLMNNSPKSEVDIARRTAFILKLKRDVMEKNKDIRNRDEMKSSTDNSGRAAFLLKPQRNVMEKNKDIRNGDEMKSATENSRRAAFLLKLRRDAMEKNKDINDK